MRLSRRTCEPAGHTDELWEETDVLLSVDAFGDLGKVARD